MIVDDLQQASQDGVCEISTRVRRADGQKLRLWWRVPEEFAPAWPDGSPFAAAALVWALEHDEHLTADVPVSPRLAASLEGFQHVYGSPYSDGRSAISLQGPVATPPPGHPITGCFFSRGVDSWYAVLSALEDDPQSPPLTHLVFSPDFVHSGWPQDVVDLQIQANLQAAARTGCEVVQVETNLRRDFASSKGEVRLACTALALGFSRVLIASDTNRLGGRHATTDERFSTERTEVINYGDAPRLRKISRIARSRDARETLHVCRSKRATAADNCGRCEKCLRTMLALHIEGVLDRSPTFPSAVKPSSIARLGKPFGRRQQWLDMVESLGDSAEDRELASAARLSIAKNDLRRVAGQLHELGVDPALERIAPALPKATDRAAALVLAAREAIHPDGPRGLRAHLRRWLAPLGINGARPRNEKRRGKRGDSGAQTPR